MNSNINISPTNVKGRCNLKCSYTFKYSESNSTAKNNGVQITLTYDSTNPPPVVYNNEKYLVENVTLVSPSIHIFNNKSMPGEIIITHNPQSGGNPLKVCIPFTSSSESSNASEIITDIINKVSTNAPSEGDSTNLNMSFSLQKIIPKKPFFVYSEDTCNWIVFGELEAIPLASSSIIKLQQIIKPFSISTTGGDLFYNSKGPTSGVQIGDGIYISCRPTGSSEEETAVEYDKNITSYDFSNIFESQIFKLIIVIIIGCVAMIGVFYTINIIYKYIISDAKKLPNLSFGKIS